MWFPVLDVSLAQHSVYIECVCIYTSIHVYMCVCVRSYAAKPGSAPYLCSPIPEGFLLRWLQPELPLQEKHHPLLSAHCCWADTAHGVCKSPKQRAFVLGTSERQNLGGLVVHDGGCNGVMTLHESRKVYGWRFWWHPVLWSTENPHLIGSFKEYRGTTLAAKHMKIPLKI